MTYKEIYGHMYVHVEESSHGLRMHDINISYIILYITIVSAKLFITAILCYTVLQGPKTTSS